MIRYFEITNKDTKESREIEIEGKFNLKAECELLSRSVKPAEGADADIPVAITKWDPRNCIARELKNNALVIDDDQQWEFEYIKQDQLPEGATVFKYVEGNSNPLPVFLLLRDKDKKIQAYNRPKIIKTPPEKLYMYLYWYETRILFAAKYPDLGKFKQGVIIAIIILLIVFTWLAVS